ncbi:MAG: fatty acid desaturase [Saprospiraceae bacterium]|nr:fatty acid desaturase [Saprospiraceae bacterium]
MLEQEIRKDLQGWQKIVVKYSKPDHYKASLQVINTFGPFIAIWGLMYFSLDWSIWITIALAIVNGFFLARLFIIQHDCGHQSFFKRKKWNDLLGFTCSLFTSLPYRYWSRVHSYHHGHQGQLEHRNVGDINFLTVEEYRNSSRWKRFAYRIFRHPVFMFLITPVLYITISNRFPFFHFKGWGKIRQSQVINNAVLVGLYLGLGYLLGWKEFFFIQLSIIFVFAVVAFWFFYVQHQHEETYMRWKGQWDHLAASIKGSSYYKLPKVFQWLTGNIGYHHIHHLNSKIPNYNLQQCARENPILQKHVPTLSFTDSLKCIYNHLYDEERHRMISFREYDSMERRAV